MSINPPETRLVKTSEALPPLWVIAPETNPNSTPVILLLVHLSIQTRNRLPVNCLVSALNNFMP
jgi:hypothetical protein